MIALPRSSTGCWGVAGTSSDGIGASGRLESGRDRHASAGRAHRLRCRAGDVGWALCRPGSGEARLLTADFSLPSLNYVFSTLVTFAVAVLYLTACWTVSGCTAGAVAMGLRVVGRRGGRVHPLAALMRAIGCVVFPIGLLWVVVDKRRRSLHDIVFRTRVVYSRPSEP